MLKTIYVGVIVFRKISVMCDNKGGRMLGTLRRSSYVCVVVTRSSIYAARKSRVVVMYVKNASW